MAIRATAAALVLCAVLGLAYWWLAGRTGTKLAEGACNSQVLGDCPGGVAQTTTAIGSAGNATVVRYVGDYRDGKRHGLGTVTWSDGNTYTGEWKDDLPHGRGRFRAPDGSYHEGEWRNGKATGRGVAVWSNGSRYDGDWRDGKLEGRGTFVFPQGNRYEGEWRGTRMTGEGRGTWADGSSYEGTWQNDWPHGRGTYVLNGATYSGRWTSGCLKAEDQIIAVGKTREQCQLLLERSVASQR